MLRVCIRRYLLRDILNKINGIHFSASEEIHTLSHLYESMLREMRDAAGDSGEFYTPRPVVRFMVQVASPQLSETVLDPACGTGGFLVEAYDHMAAQVKTPDQRRALQRSTLFGQEAKPLPYMLAQMNLLLHGLEAPDAQPRGRGDAPARRDRELGERGASMRQLVTGGAIEGLGYRGIQSDIVSKLAVACHSATRSPDSLMTACYLEIGTVLRAVDTRYAGRNHGENGE